MKKRTEKQELQKKVENYISTLNRFKWTIFNDEENIKNWSEEIENTAKIIAKECNNF